MGSLKRRQQPRMPRPAQAEAVLSVARIGEPENQGKGMLFARLVGLKRLADIKAEEIKS
jgi:hypothetical protein